MSKTEIRPLWVPEGNLCLRRGRIIRTSIQDEVHPSINAAKRRSRELQSSGFRVRCVEVLHERADEVQAVLIKK